MQTLYIFRCVILCKYKPVVRLCFIHLYILSQCILYSHIYLLRMTMIIKSYMGICYIFFLRHYTKCLAWYKVAGCIFYNFMKLNMLYFDWCLSMIKSFSIFEVKILNWICYILSLFHFYFTCCSISNIHFIYWCWW